MIHSLRNSRWLDALYLLLCALFVLAGVSSVPLHGDEPTQIFMGRDFYYQFVQGDTTRLNFQAWDELDPDAATEQDLRLINGSLVKYLFGATAYLSGYDIDEVNQQWLWGAGWDWNHANGHVPTDDLLLRTRIVSSLLLALSVIVVFFIGQYLGGRGVAYLSSLYYVLNPAILINGRRVMMESSLLLFSLLVVLMALYALRDKKWWLYLLLGLVAGLAVASKHTGVVTVAAVFMAAGGYLLITRQLRAIGLLFVAGVLSLAVFFALNPAWWGNPLHTASEIATLRTNLLNGQIDAFGGYDSLTEQVAGFARQVFVVLPMVAETSVDDFEANQADIISTYDNSLLAGVSIGGSTIGAVLLLLCVGMGIWSLRQLDASSLTIVALWSLAMLMLTLFVTPLEWQRYYLPIYPVIGLLAALGIVRVYKRLNSQQSSVHHV